MYWYCLQHLRNKRSILENLGRPNYFPINHDQSTKDADALIDFMQFLTNLNKIKERASNEYIKHYAFVIIYGDVQS